MKNLEEHSKTCQCEWLKEAAEDVRFPIEYDKDKNQFKLRCLLDDDHIGFTVLHYCPLCGGLAPDVRKEQNFLDLSSQELLRLKRITGEIKSIEDALRVLGHPEELMEQVKREITDLYVEELRSLTYHNVSETAVIHVIADDDGSVRIVFQEKYIKKRHSA